MSKTNVCSFLCKECSKDEQTIKNIINEIKVSQDKKESISIATIISGIKPDRETFCLDYFIQLLCDENLSEDKKKCLHLFSVTMIPRDSEECQGIDRMKTGYDGSFFHTLYDDVSISFPEKGYYELRVFMSDQSIAGTAKERYIKYQEENIEPITVYSFKVS